MKLFKPWRWLLRKRNAVFEWGKCGLKMKQLRCMGIVCVIIFILYRTTNYQYWQTEMEAELYPGMFKSSDTDKRSYGVSRLLRNLPRGIIQANADMELKPLWASQRSKAVVSSNLNLLAIPVGIKQKDNVDLIAKKFLAENFTIILFHYDGHVDDWWSLDWSNKAIHIVAQNQTKWWFAKRFLHPNVVSKYDYIFLWDEDLGVEHFHPGRYLDIVKEEGLEISQPALDPNSTDIHHRLTVRSKKKTFHRRVYDRRGNMKCSDESGGPPCTGFVEGMAPVFSRSAWYCAWHLIQSDLVHGWGMDIKLGYCAQGDRTKKVGIVDQEYIVHKGIQTLGGGSPSQKKVLKRQGLSKRPALDVRVEIRRQSTSELGIFKDRWNRAVEEDKLWVDPFKRDTKWRKRRRLQL